MKRLAVFVLLLTSAARASNPGEPLDCSDWVLVEPGLSCSYWLNEFRCHPQANPLCEPAVSKASTDNNGRQFRIVKIPLSTPCPHTFPLYRLELRAVNGTQQTTETVIAYLEERCDLTSADLTRWSYPEYLGVLFLEESGKVVLQQFRSSGLGTSTEYGVADWAPVFSGFPTTFDVLQTFTPQSSLGFRVLYMPEGWPPPTRSIPTGVR
jgi:hypothetical protein